MLVITNIIKHILHYNVRFIKPFLKGFFNYF